MNCSRGDTLAEFAFSYYEKLHQPIFLINKKGKVIRLNEFCRKLAKILKIDLKDSNLLANFDFDFAKNEGRIHTVLTSKLKLKALVTNFANSDYALIELKRTKASKMLR